MTYERIGEYDFQNRKVLFINQGKAIDGDFGLFYYSHWPDRGVSMSVLEHFIESGDVSGELYERLLEKLFYRVRELNVGRAGRKLGPADYLDFTAIIESFNYLPGGFSRALSVATATLEGLTAQLGQTVVLKFHC